MWLLVALAQIAQASVGGVVRDAETGEPLAGAVVELADIDRTVLSDADGRYTFVRVPVGPQHVTVRRIGYAPRSLHALVPASGALELSITLRSIPVRLRTVEIRPLVVVRGTERAEEVLLGERAISIAAIRHHPLLAEPDAFLALGGGEVRVRPEAPAGVHIMGGAADQTGYAIDGVPIFNPHHAAGTVSAWNPDAIEQAGLSGSPWLQSALSETVSGTTRTPGRSARAQGSVSTTQARATVDGPLGFADGGYLISVRSGFPGIVEPRSEPSYLRGENGDVLAKIELAGPRGRLRLLGYDNQNELSSAAVIGSGDLPPADQSRNEFAWHSRSLGGQWSGSMGGAAVRILGWSAGTDATATWMAESDDPTNLSADRQDHGLFVDAERGATGAGVHLIRSVTRYVAGRESGGGLALLGRTSSATAFARHSRRLARALEGSLVLSGTVAGRHIHADPRATLRWTPSPAVGVSASWARSHQLAQSLRNPESVIGSVFPVDLYVGGDETGIPTATSDRLVLAAEYRPRDGVRLAGQAYGRSVEDVTLVAPRTEEPFADRAPVTGWGRVRGAALDVAMSGARYGIVTTYGWQRVRLYHADSSYVPDYGTTHTLDAGVILFTTATSSISLGAAGAIGRRATPAAESFEWESCNLLDDGCELSGSPRHPSDRLGATKLPAYLRLDLGVRKHWHFRVAGRDAQVGLFGTLTNVLGRRNVFVVAADPSSGNDVAIAMRPRAPLVMGLDWRF